VRYGVTGGPLDAVRPAGARREEGVNSRALGVREAWGRSGASAGWKTSECPCLNVSNSKKLNKSAPNNE
jgi:hypothetical protein